MLYRVGHRIEILYFKDISGSFSLKSLFVCGSYTSLFPLLFCTHALLGREVIIIYLSSQALPPSGGVHEFSQSLSSQFP